MLATLTDEPFSDEAWVFERKLDGVRCLAFRDGDEVRLRSRTRKILDDTYPEMIDALRAQPVAQFGVDGEVVAFEGDRTSFARLQQRLGITDPVRADRSPVAVYFCVFDLLHLEGHDTTPLPLRERKSFLRRALEFDGPLRFSTPSQRRRPGLPRGHLPTGLGGPHRQAGRQPLCREAVTRLAQAQVLGTPGVRRRRLHRPRRHPGGLRRPARRLLRRARPRLRREGWHGLLRHPRFEGLRDDKRPADIVRDQPTPRVDSS